MLHAPYCSCQNIRLFILTAPLGTPCRYHIMRQLTLCYLLVINPRLGFLALSAIFLIDYMDLYHPVLRSISGCRRVHTICNCTILKVFDDTVLMFFGCQAVFKRGKTKILVENEHVLIYGTLLTSPLPK